MAATANEALRQSLQVAPPSEIVDWINLLVYGEAGAGKTYLGGTAEDSSETSPLLVFDVEGGMTTLRSRTSVDVISVRSIDDVEGNYNKLYHSIEYDDKGKPSMYYKTVMIDSLPELADLDMRKVMKEAFGRNPEKVDIDVPSPREWGIVRNHLRLIVRAFRDLPCNVVFTAGLGLLQEEGQPTKMFPAFAGKLQREVPGFADIVGYLYAEADSLGSGVITRKLQVAGTRRVVAKDRTSSLGDVIENPTIPKIWDLIHNTSTSNS